jgi:hypothetical protein
MGRITGFSGKLQKKTLNTCLCDASPTQAHRVYTVTATAAPRLSVQRAHQQGAVRGENDEELTKYQPPGRRIADSYHQWKGSSWPRTR